MDTKTTRLALGKVLASILAVVALLFGAATASTLAASPAAAADGGYPWASAPCEFGAAGGASCKNPNNANDLYDWYVDENGSGGFTGGMCGGSSPSGECFDPWGYQYRNCTSFVAWKINQVFGVNVSGWGNAKDWATRAGNSGYTISTSPHVGDIAVWTSGSFGHVAYVSALIDGVPKLEEYNKSANGTYSSSRLAGADLYVHIGAIPFSPVDTDGDGLTDDVDQCPTKAGPASNNGCPIPQPTFHVYTGTSTGTLHETYWGPNDGQTTAELAELDSPVASTSSQITSDGVNHVFSADTSGKIRETYWGGGNSLTTWQLANIGTADPITSISSDITYSPNRVNHVYSATSTGKIFETYWGPNDTLTTYQLTSVSSAIKSLVAFRSSNGVNHAFYGTASGKIFETYWGPTQVKTTEQKGDVGTRINTISVEFSPNSVWHIYSGTDTGKVYETYWGGGYSLSTEQKASLSSAVTALTSNTTSDLVNHIYSGTTNGTLHETYWGGGNSLTTWQLANIGSPITGVSPQRTSDGVMHLFTGTSSGTIKETYWGPGAYLTTWQVGVDPSAVTSVNSKFTTN